MDAEEEGMWREGGCGGRVDVDVKGVDVEGG